MERYLIVLKSFKRMPLELEETYRKHVRSISVRQHEIIQKPGEVTDNIYFVEKGLFRIYDDDAKDATRGFRIEDDFIIALKRLTPGKEYVDGIEALEDGILWCIPGRLIKDLEHRFPQCREHYLTILTKDWIHLEETERYTSWRGGSANYRALRKYAPELLDRVPIPYLADYTHIPEKVFRHLHSSKIQLYVSTKRRRKR